MGGHPFLFQPPLRHYPGGIDFAYNNYEAIFEAKSSFVVLLVTIILFVNEINVFKEECEGLYFEQAS